MFFQSSLPPSIRLHAAASEEKVDEYFQFQSQRADHQQRTGTCGSSSGRPAAAFDIDEMILDLDALVRGEERASDDNSEMETTSDDFVQRATKKTRQSSSPRSRSAAANRILGIDESSSLPADAKSSRMAQDIISLGEHEVHRIISDATRFLTNVPPPASFVVHQCDNDKRVAKRRPFQLGEMSYRDCGETRMKGGGDRNDGKDGPESTEGVETNVRDGPPLFDGSVANATPGSVADRGLEVGGMGEVGGGTGTVLHLACAIDSPFALAVALAMGGDATSRHTAFRRLMIHEAACANSPDCLRLILEVGKIHCGPGMPVHETDDSGCWNPNAHQLESSIFGSGQHGLGRPRAIALPTMRSDERHGLAPSPSSFRSLFSIWADRQRASNEMLKESTSESSPVSFVDGLQIVSKLGKQILQGSITDLDAARQLIARVGLPDLTKMAIASACTQMSSEKYINSNSHAEILSSPFRGPRGGRPTSDSDGHGNTPLHWACFKNSVECVSVLLSHNVDPNSRAEPSGWTPLHDAAYSDAAECARLLVKAGANVDARASSGATPLCFAAQEDAPEAARLLLEAGADPAVRCAHEGSLIAAATAAGTNPQQQHAQASRFSGYTPLHYCAHYNAHRAVRVLLEHERCALKVSPSILLEIQDFNERLPIHIAVGRSSSDVLRELLRGGARVDIKKRTNDVAAAGSPPRLAAGPLASQNETVAVPSSPRMHAAWNAVQSSYLTPMATSHSPAIITPVSSPALRSMVPSRPITSSKPWNCITQESIDQCQDLLLKTELNWSPDRHSIFHPNDRRAVNELFRVGKRLEQLGTGIYIYHLWPYVLSFCGRGWFEQEEAEGVGTGSKTNMDTLDLNFSNEQNQKLAASSCMFLDHEEIRTRSVSEDLTQFHLE